MESRGVVNLIGNEGTVMNRSQLMVVIALFGSLALLISGCGGGGECGTSALGQVSGSIGNLAPGSTATVRIEGADASAVVAPDGTFVLDGVPAGVQTLVAVSGTDGQAAAVCVWVEPGKVTNVGRLALRDAGQISGLVTSQATGDPVAGALVTVVEEVSSGPDQMAHPVRVAYTDRAGSYTVSGLPAGDYVVTVDKEGFESASLSVTVNARATSTGDVALVPVSPAETGSVEGIVFVRNADGTTTPLAGVLVRLADLGDPYILEPLPLRAAPPSRGVDDSWTPPSPYRDYCAFTDENGEYSIEGVPAGHYLAVAVRPGFEPERKEVDVVSGETVTVDFLLTAERPRFGTVEGTVTDSVTGKPIPGALVVAVVDFITPCLQLPGGCGGMIYPDPCVSLMKTMTDADGHYRLLVPGFVTKIGFSKQGYQAQEVDVEVVLGGTVTLDVSLTPE